MTVDRKRRWPWVLVAVALLLIGSSLASAHYWYTPTTHAVVVNDTSATYTLDNCEDYLVTVTPGQSEQVEPFVNEHHGCTVYRGSANVGSPVGCLVFPATHGSVVVGSRVKLSAMVPFSAQRCQGN